MNEDYSMTYTQTFSGDTYQYTTQYKKEKTMSTVIKEGDKVIFKTKEDLIEEFGADAAGYPETTIRFNHAGHMDHYFGATGTVTKLNAERGFIQVDFEDQVPGADYSWALSVDVFALDDGTYLGATQKEPVRAFMPGKESPTPKQVWTALLALKKKEDIADGMPVYMMNLFALRGFEHVKRIAEYTEASSFQVTSIPAFVVGFEANYPKINIEVILLTFKVLEGSMDKKLRVLAEELVAMKVNSALQLELSDTPYTRMKRVLATPTKEVIDSLWGHLEIDDSFLTVARHQSASTLKNLISEKIVDFLNEDQKRTHLQDGDIVKIGA